MDMRTPHFVARPDLSGRLVKPVTRGIVASESARPGDRDGDGIADANDACPDAPEDRDGMSDEDAVARVKDLTDGWGADIVVEVAGFARVIPLGVKMLRIGGRYLLQGSVYPDDPFTTTSNEVIIKCLTLVGLHNYDSRYLGMAMSLVHRSRDTYPYSKLAGPEFPLTAEGVTGALESLEKRESIRPIVVP